MIAAFIGVLGFFLSVINTVLAILKNQREAAALRQAKEEKETSTFDFEYGEQVLTPTSCRLEFKITHTSGLPVSGASPRVRFNYKQPNKDFRRIKRYMDPRGILSPSMPLSESDVVYLDPWLMGQKRTYKFEMKNGDEWRRLSLDTDDVAKISIWKDGKELGAFDISTLFRSAVSQMVLPERERPPPGMPGGGPYIPSNQRK